ncbi:hypothetical protein [Arthrobacter sp. Y-9]|uniref:hypothetical protein n=1 Tax=Arthrobacter sp. Y-9 TaxID=3039385 RepID=UPI00241CC92E|nr:hypothetical protein [Arthrobacter sp. Y-9]WFR84653.1 hypothetical protein P9849_03160 [Arthrobacter sp. Y-9]
MGSKNVAKVFENWPGLNDKPKLALIWMSSQARDDDRPPVFWGQREELAHAIGVGPDNADAAGRAVRRALKDLQNAGAITWSGQAYRGVGSSYALCLDPTVRWRPTGSGRDITWILDNRDPPEASVDNPP